MGRRLVVEGVTGVFFDHQTVEALAEAIEHVDSLAFDRSAIRANAERFSREVFRRKWVALIERLGVDRELYRSDRL